MYITWYTCKFGAMCSLKLSAKMLEFCLKKPMWFDRVYFSDHKCINIMLLKWLEVIITHKISGNMYKYISNNIDMLMLDCFTYGIEFLPDLGWFVLNWFVVTMYTCGRLFTEISPL